MNEKKLNKYEVSLLQLKNKEGEHVNEPAISFLFDNHDNISEILNKLSDKNIFDDEDQLKQFVVGLKLFGDVVMKNKDKALFSEMHPAFISFMKKLKS